MQADPEPGILVELTSSFDSVCGNIGFDEPSKTLTLCRSSRCIDDRLDDLFCTEDRRRSESQNVSCVPTLDLVRFRANTATGFELTYVVLKYAARDRNYTGDIVVPRTRPRLYVTEMRCGVRL